jgi:hypothetical protein
MAKKNQHKFAHVFERLETGGRLTTHPVHAGYKVQITNVFLMHDSRAVVS